MKSIKSTRQQQGHRSNTSAASKNRKTTNNRGSIRNGYFFIYTLLLQISIHSPLSHSTLVSLVKIGKAASVGASNSVTHINFLHFFFPIEYPIVFARRLQRMACNCGELHTVANDGEVDVERAGKDGEYPAGFCFDMPLEVLWRLFSTYFYRFMLNGYSDSSRHAKTVKKEKKMKKKSCLTYQSTISNVIYEGSEYNRRVLDILNEETEKGFVQQQHFLHDTQTKTRLKKSNIYKPSFRKLFQWFKYLSFSKDACHCDTCKQTKYLFLHKEEQGEDGQTLCLNCNCGKHYTFNGQPSASCRTCHIFDPVTSRFLCLGRTQCSLCYRYCANCRFHEMNEILSEHKEWQEAVLRGNLHVCDSCIHRKTANIACMILNLSQKGSPSDVPDEKESK